jgi:hypothetical protein
MLNIQLQVALRVRVGVELAIFIASLTHLYRTVQYGAALLWLSRSKGLILVVPALVVIEKASP